MSRNDGCENLTSSQDVSGYESTRIRKTNASCSLCENFATSQSSKRIAVMSCEGACLRGEISRQAANLVCHSMEPEKTVRICLGGAFTKNTGQRSLVRNAERVIAIEGCPILCATRMMQGVIDGLKVEVVEADRSCSFDQTHFGIDEMSEEEIKICARDVARKVVEIL